MLILHLVKKEFFHISRERERKSSQEKEKEKERVLKRKRRESALSRCFFNIM